MKKRRTGKYICFLVMFSMLTSLLTGFPVQTASAEGETGLLITDDINWDSETPEVNAGAEYGKERWCDLPGITCSLKYVDGTGNSTDISANQITTVKVKSDGEDFKEDATVAYSENETNHALVDLSFQHCGEYRIYYTPKQGEESYATVYVEFPAIGFYKTQTPGDDTFLSGLNLAESSSEFYMVLDKRENQTLTFDSFEINGDDSLNPEDYLSYEPVSKNVYKITINPYQVYGANDGINLRAKGKVSEGDDTWETDCWLHITYHTEKILWFTDQFTDSWGDNGPDNVADNAEYWRDSIWISRPSDAWVAFKYGDDMVTAEQLTITDIHGNPAEGVQICNGSKEGIVRIYLPKTGKYIITYKEGDKIAGALEVFVNLPSVGFYRSETLSEEELPTNENGAGYLFKYGKLSNRIFYLLYGNEEGMTISDMKITTYLCNEQGDWEPKQSDILTYEPLSSGKGYQFTIKENAEEEFIVEAFCKKTYTQEDGKTEEYEEDISMFLMPNGLKEDFDLSKAAWNYTEAFTYDGKEKEVVLTGLPEGLNVSYSGNKAAEAGDYTAKATFSYDTDLYNAPDLSKISELKWRIVKKNTTESPKVGKKLVVNGVTYQITSLKGGKKEVSYLSSSKKAVKVTVPGTVTVNGTSYKVTTIADNAFAKNSKLASIKISDNITKIGKSTFSGCSKLKKITVPKNVTEIGKNAFKDCKNLSQITFQGTKIKKIGQNAFKNVSKKAVIKVPKSKKAAYKKLLKKAGYNKSVK